MLIYIPSAQCSLYDWAERGAEGAIFFWMCPSPHRFIPAVHHTCETFIPCFCLKLCTPLLEYFQEASGYKIYICCSLNFVLSFFLLTAEEVNAYT